jgi:hypothetical protein
MSTNGVIDHSEQGEHHDQVAECGQEMDLTDEFRDAVGPMPESVLRTSIAAVRRALESVPNPSGRHHP